MTQYIQITTSCDQKPALASLANALVEQQLAACVQISGPVSSTYRWQGKVETAEEWLCTVKTTGQRQDAVVDLIRSLHPYDEPEVIATPITGGSPTYLDWLARQVDRE